jgi:CDP-diacylglycerol--serine O-phosphatidyltransferase
MAAKIPPPKYFVPNACTALSMLCGLGSVAASVDHQYALAAWMILWGVLLDKLDGTFARLLRATSGFGVQFDSFADFVVFGFAPAGLVYFRLQDAAAWQGVYHYLLLACCGLFVVAVAGRLARFNISEPPMGDRYFYGIPTTLCGGTLALLYLTIEHQKLGESWVAPFPFYLLIAGVLMISSLRLPKLKARRNLPLNVFQFGNVLAAYVLGAMRLCPEYLLGLAVTYLVVGVGWCLLFPPHEADADSDDDDESLTEEPAA